MRVFAVVLACVFCAGVPAAQAQDAAKPAAACGPLTMVNTIQMIRGPNPVDQDFVPILFDSGVRYFLFDTGGAKTQIAMPAAREMDLHIFDGTNMLVDVRGRGSDKLASIDEFVLGHMRGDTANFPILATPALMDGLFALDYLVSYDADIDFGTDKLNFFSPDHCPGNVLYWTAPVVAALPITMDHSIHVVVPVQLDGHEFQAVIDSGADETTIRKDRADNVFDLTMGDADTPLRGAPFSNSTYQHKFKSLTFGDVIVSNPRIDIIPENPRGREVTPELIIGMDVLRKLHLYFAFKEGKLYISQASSSPSGLATAPIPEVFAANTVKAINQMLLEKPDQAAGLNDRCFWQGVEKKDLDAAMADCDQSLKLRPQSAATLDSRGFVLYQQGKFQDSVAAYNAALALDAKRADSLYMRGRAKAKLGDQAGRDTDVAAALAINSNVQTYFQRLGIADEANP